jgi:cyclophilin family peptidyl-prolyl cis-trans isomerase
MKHSHVRALTAVLLVVLCAFMMLATGCDKQKAPLFAELDFSAVDPAACKETEEVTNYVKITITSAGGEGLEDITYEDIIIRLFPEVAPGTVENFQSLVSRKFYDGLTFHRVIKNFMIQGGDPKGDGTGDAGKDIKGEFMANGFENNLKHVSGVVSMARGNPYDSASCQFFIVHKTSAHLDGKYASFGYVVSGMDTVDAIAKLPVDGSDKPLKTVTIQSIRFVQPE